MKKTISICAVLVFTLILVGAGCGDMTGNHNKPVVEIDDFSIVEAGVVVKKYMTYTLGTTPGATVDYEKAKKFLTPELEAQFTDPMFVPTSYCIQNGPDDVRLIPPEFDENMNRVDVVVEGEYGDGEWMKMWKFQVVPVEGDDWMINKIDCLHI